MCVTLHASSIISAIPCFMTPPPYSLHDTRKKIIWGATYNMHRLKETPTQNWLIEKMDNLLTNKGTQSAQVTESLTMKLDESNIGGRCIKFWLVECFKELMNTVIKLIDWFDYTCGGGGGVLEIIIYCFYFSLAISIDGEEVSRVFRVIGQSLELHSLIIR